MDNFVLKDKNILFIGPKYFNYEFQIINELKKKGANVYYIPENLDDFNMIYRFLYAFGGKYKEKILNGYYYKKINKCKFIPEYIFVIRGASLTEISMDKLKRDYPNAKYIMYQWDSVNNNPNSIEIADYFDKVCTFDTEDANKYDWEYRPLFYSSSEQDNDLEKDIDLLYICSLHSQRAIVLKNLQEYCSKNRYRLFTHVYVKWPIFYKRKYLCNEYKDVSSKDVKFISLSSDEMNSYYHRAKVVVDYAHPEQTGLTMRTIECLGAKCKLVTNNMNVKSADFYNDKNILVYKGTDINISEEFVKSEYLKLSNVIYNKYSIEEWVNDLFDLVKTGELYEQNRK